MKNLLLSILLLGFITAKAQSVSETLSIAGLVENPLTLKINDLQQMYKEKRFSFIIISFIAYVFFSIAIYKQFIKVEVERQSILDAFYIIPSKSERKRKIIFCRHRNGWIYGYFFLPRNFQ